MPGAANSSDTRGAAVRFEMPTRPQGAKVISPGGQCSPSPRPRSSVIGKSESPVLTGRSSVSAGGQ